MRFVASLLLVVLALAAASACKPTITQTLQTSWIDGSGVQYSMFDVSINVPANSASLRSVMLALDSEATNEATGQWWEMTKPVPGFPVFALPPWRLQNGGIPSGQSHRWGYVIRSANPATFAVSSWACGNDGPIPSPDASPSAVPVPSPPAIPRIPDGATCKAVLIIDNYIVRNLPSLTTEQIKEKYLAYFADVTTFYRHNFNLDIELAYTYVETTGSFTDEMNGNKLLDNFKAAIQQATFGKPTGACIYHLLSARQPPGVGGIAFLGAACTGGGGVGFSVDGQSSEPAELVIRRMIHEIGHNFAGSHPDDYSSFKGYSCSINQDRENDRILRDEPVSYNYLSPTAFISDCASLTITSSLPAFDCMWSSDDTSSYFPKAIFCKDQAAEGGCLEVPALIGTDACYNILNYNDAVSSFQLFPGTTPAVGIRLYFDVDCLGGSVDVREFYSQTLPSNIDNQASSFRFIMQ